jgi:4-alpha-glucanotransferase
MESIRSSGILLHPTSLPSPDGIGDLGPDVFSWLDFLKAAGCQMWQILPLGPTSYGDSPYQCFSAFAGNPYLISSTLLLDENLLSINDLIDRPEFPTDQIDYGPVIQWKIKLLERSYNRFKAFKNKKLQAEFSLFVDQNNFWLEDYALFMAIKQHEGNVSWEYWPSDFRQRKQNSLNEFSDDHISSIDEQKYRQFIFFRQWEKVRQYASSLNIKIIGDIPIFIAYDSADAWSNPDLFHLDKSGKPTVVAGVPPDYFSKTGQLWGNPLYRWDIHKKSGFAWWTRRINSVLKMVDIIRLDHFRGFEAFWEVPYGNPTAEIGRWVKGPGKDFFTSLKTNLGDLPIIAEDLGVITDEVVEIRDEFKLPGMKILQFAFSDNPDDTFLPHNYPVNCFAYTGSHDNDTALGWYSKANEEEKDFCRRYLSVSGDDISWSMMRSIWQSVSNYVLAPMQDLLSLGTEARMNLPGSPSGNWSWRMPATSLSEILQTRLYELNYLYGRLPKDEKLRLLKNVDAEQSEVVKPH